MSVTSSARMVSGVRRQSEPQPLREPGMEDDAPKTYAIIRETVVVLPDLEPSAHPELHSYLCRLDLAVQTENKQELKECLEILDWLCQDPKGDWEPCEDGEDTDDDVDPEYLEVSDEVPAFWQVTIRGQVQTLTREHAAEIHRQFHALRIHSRKNLLEYSDLFSLSDNRSCKRIKTENLRVKPLDGRTPSPIVYIVCP